MALACVAWFSAPVAGRQAAGAPPNQVESDPIRCWWRTDKEGVRVGEPFTLVLTCGLVDTDGVQVVVDPARLDPAALEMTPFEVLGGTRHQEVSARPWRYFQYSYTLRLLAEEFFGRDVDIPALALTYRVQSAQGGADERRERLYLLPALPVRVLSLVPVTATDIRDSLPETFANIEARSWRATEELAAAAVLFAFAAGLLALVALRVVRRARAAESPAEAPLPMHTLLRACEREARRLESAAASGWTPDLVERGLALFRIAGAVALGGPVAQTLAGRHERARDGQLGLETGLWRPRRVLVSSSTTAATIGGRLAAGEQEIGPHLRDALEDLAASLQAFGTAHYSRSGQLETEALDGALDRGMRSIHGLRVAEPWPARAAGALARTAAALREATWAR